MCMCSWRYDDDGYWRYSGQYLSEHRAYMCVHMFGHSTARRCNCQSRITYHTTHKKRNGGLESDQRPHNIRKMSRRVWPRSGFYIINAHTYMHTNILQSHRIFWHLFGIECRHASYMLWQAIFGLVFEFRVDPTRRDGKKTYLFEVWCRIAPFDGKCEEATSLIYRISYLLQWWSIWCQTSAVELVVEWFGFDSCEHI